MCVQNGHNKGTLEKDRDNLFDAADAMNLIGLPIHHRCIIDRCIINQFILEINTSLMM